jgi:hypothetical protein
MYLSTERVTILGRKFQVEITDLDASTLFPKIFNHQAFVGLLLKNHQQ